MERSSLMLRNLNTGLPNEVRAILEEEIVWADDGQWNRLGMPALIGNIVELRAVKLYAEENFECKILNQICHIGFPQLQWLSLGENHIESIECLPRLQTPQLKELYLSGNHIASWLPLRKYHQSLLTEMDIGDNRATDHFMLAELNLSEADFVNLKCPLSFSIFAKSEIPWGISEIYINVSPQRMHSREAIKLQQKFPCLIVREEE